MGDVYTLTSDIDGYVFVDRNNTVFDGAGYSVKGIYGQLFVQIGVLPQIENMTNLTIMNTIIIDGGGIFFLASSNSIVANNTLNICSGLYCSGNKNIIANNTVNSGRGISGRGNGNIISGNHITNCNYTFPPNNPSPDGIIIEGSSNSIMGNIIVGNNGTAINLLTSSNNIVIGNQLSDNEVGISTMNIFHKVGLKITWFIITISSTITKMFTMKE